MSTQKISPTSFQWMANAGVDPNDVAWLAGMEGSVQLHAPGYRERVEKIYLDALASLLSKPSPIADFIRHLN